MEERQKIDFQTIIKDTYFANGDISFKRMGEFCEHPSDEIQFISFDNSILQEIDFHFPVLNISDILKTKLNQICRLAITKPIFDGLQKLLKNRYINLKKYQVQIALIICFGIPYNGKFKFHNAGKSSKIQDELSKLKRLLQEQVEVELGFTVPVYENSEDNTVEYGRGIVSHPKYFIDKIIVELKDDDNNTKAIKMNIYDKKEDSLIWEKAKMDIFLWKLLKMP